MGRKPCGKRRNCSLQAISPFSHSVFKRLVWQTRKNQGLFGKGFIATFQLLSAVSFNLGWSGNGVLNSLPNNNFLDWTKLKAFADNKLNAGKIKNSVFERLENIAGKGGNAGYPHFLLFPQCF